MAKTKKMSEADLQAFRDLAAQQKRLGRGATRLYALEVDAVLRSKERDSQHIEHLLDRMLGFCFDADMLVLFKKLCRYYLRIDPTATAAYVHTYREMWSQELEAGDE